MRVFQNVGDLYVYVGFLFLPIVSGLLLVELAHYSRRRAQRRKWPVLVCANLLFFVFWASIAVLVLESYYRFWCDTTESFGLTRVTQRWFLRHYQNNRAGFRDSLEDYPLAITPGKRRLTFLGDSFTVGQGIPDVEDRFANRVRKRESGWEVQVMALNGYDTKEELALVEKMVAQRYQFDEVVLVYCLNDIADITPEWKATLNRIYGTKGPGFLFTHSFFLNMYYYRFKAWRDPDISNYFHFVTKAYDGPIWNQQKTRLKTLRDMVEANGGHLSVVTFPFLDHLGPEYEFGSAHKKLDEFWAGLAVPHLDLLNVYNLHRDQNLTVNSHDAHPSLSAHALAADAIVGFLEKNVRSDGGPGTSAR
jgi:hypothetical protein